jgi:hypothetical protein
LVNKEQQVRIQNMEQQQQQSFEQLDAIRIFKQRMIYLKQLEQHFEEKRKRDEEEESKEDSSIILNNNHSNILNSNNSVSNPVNIKSPISSPRFGLNTPSDQFNRSPNQRISSPLSNYSSPSILSSRSNTTTKSSTSTEEIKLEKNEKSPGMILQVIDNQVFQKLNFLLFSPHKSSF